MKKLLLVLLVPIFTACGFGTTETNFACEGVDEFYAPKTRGYFNPISKDKTRFTIKVKKTVPVFGKTKYFMITPYGGFYDGAPEHSLYVLDNALTGYENYTKRISTSMDFNLVNGDLMIRRIHNDDAINTIPANADSINIYRVTCKPSKPLIWG